MVAVSSPDPAESSLAVWPGKSGGADGGTPVRGVTGLTSSDSAEGGPVVGDVWEGVVVGVGGTVVGDVPGVVMGDLRGFVVDLGVVVEVVGVEVEDVVGVVVEVVGVEVVVVAVRVVDVVVVDAAMTCTEVEAQDDPGPGPC